MRTCQSKKFLSPVTRVHSGRNKKDNFIFTARGNIRLNLNNLGLKTVASLDLFLASSGHKHTLLQMSTFSSAQIRNAFSRSVLILMSLDTLCFYSVATLYGWVQYRSLDCFKIAFCDPQIENGILLPSLRPMLPLLDLHGIKRLDFHNSVLEDLREKLVRTTFYFLNSNLIHPAFLYAFSSQVFLWCQLSDYIN